MFMENVGRCRSVVVVHCKAKTNYLETRLQLLCASH